MNIRNECSFLKPEGIAKIEKAYNAKYVFESCIKDRDGGWCNWPSAIFYTEEAHPQGSNYFALYHERVSIGREPQFMITNGISAIEPFDALQVGDDVIYSRYRHDYREYKGYMVDGGRDYFRRSADGTPVKLCVNKDKLEIVNA
jgi:hypothetical protein